MYYDDEDDNPYAPHIGPAAMPSPRSKFAPYYTGHANTFEDFLDEFEGRAYDCALTDPQRVDVLIRYVAPSLRDFWKSLNGYRSRDWPLFQQSLVTIFGNPIPRHQIMKQKLHSHVQDSSRRRMDCEDDVSQYYRQFLCYSAPLVHTGHLSEEERDAAFWYGFHPEDRQVLQPRLLSKNPLQPPDVPFHFEDVFGCARAAFAYDNYFPSPWSQELKFGPSSRCERPVAKHGSRDTYGLREMSRAVTSNAETTSNLDVLPSPPQSTPQPQFPSPSPSVLEPHQTQAPSVTLDQPEPEYTLSTTLLPSASFPTPSHASSLAPSAVDEDPEILTTFPSPSITPAPFSMPMSDFEYLSSATVDQPAPTLSSTSPSSSSISPMFVPSATEDQSEPEFTPTLFASVPTLTSTPSHVHSATGYGTIFASTPPSSSPTSSPCLPAVTEEQPEPETESIPSITPASTFALTPPSSSTFLPSPTQSVIVDQPESEPVSAPLPLSSITSTDLERVPSPVILAVDDVPEPESALASLVPPSIGHVPIFAPTPHAMSSVSLTNFECLPLAVVDKPEFEPEHASLCSISPTSPPPPAPSLALEFADDVPELSSSLPTSQSSSLASSTPPLPSGQSFESLPFELRALAQSSACELEFFPYSSSAVDFAPPSSESPEFSQSLSSLGEAFPFLPASLEAPPIAPISPNSTPPQRPSGSKTFNSDSSLLEVTPLASSVPQQSQELLLAYEVSLIKPPALAPRPSASARFNFALSLITVAALVSTFFNVSADLLTYTRKFRGKQDINDIRIDTLKASSCDAFTHRLRLGQYTPRAPRLVFDPGGVFKFKRSSSRLPSAHEDVRKRMPKTPNGFITHVAIAIAIPVPTDHLIVFDPGGQSPSSSVQVQDYFRHTKTYASASRSHATTSSRTPLSPFP
ncbi:hypothetical protein EDB85DRAFT_1528554, partial [Lactarius pseudohatsudake]